MRSKVLDYNASPVKNCSVSNCTNFQDFNLNDLLKCYRYLYSLNWHLNTAEILLALFIVVLNVFVIAILCRKPAKMTIFDKLMIAHCIVDGLTGLLDVPFFHFTHVLGFWPFGTASSLIWTSFDNGINVITNLHMLLITWIRFRSIKAPKTFEKEALARHPFILSISIWLTGLVIWTALTLSFGVDDYSTNVRFNPDFLGIILIFLTWFIPLTAIIILAVYILVILNRRRRQVATMRKFSPSVTHVSALPINSEFPTNTSKRRVFKKKLKSAFRLGPQIRFQIIITSYWIQWFPSCLIALIDPICLCVPSNVSSTIYWLTYTVCLTDPLVILIFNPNVALSKRGH